MESQMKNPRADTEIRIGEWAQFASGLDPEIRAAARQGFDVQMAVVNEIASDMMQYVGAKASLVVADHELVATTRSDLKIRSKVALTESSDYVKSVMGHKFPTSLFPISNIRVCRVLHDWPHFRQPPQKFTAVVCSVDSPGYPVVHIVLPLDRPEVRPAPRRRKERRP